MRQTEQLARHFIRAHGLWCVYVARDRSGEFAAVARDLHIVQRRLAERRGHLDGAWWFATRDEAQAVADRFIFQGEQTVPAAALALRIACTPHNDVQRRAAEAVDLIRRNIDRMMRAGQLRHVNAEYRDLRIRQAAAGIRTPSYAVYIRRYAIMMLYQAAGNGAAERRPAAPEFEPA